MSVSDQKRGFFIVMMPVLFVALFMLSSCTGIPGRRDPSTQMGDFKDNKYYQGFQGVEMAFVQGMPPTKVYYYGDQFDNTFDVNVEVGNIGSSWSRGAIFLSGYDPTMIKVQGIEPMRGRGTSCHLNIGNIGFGQLGGVFACNDFFIGASKDMEFFEVGLKDFGSRFEMGRLTGGTDAWFRKNGDEWVVDVSNPSFDVEYSNHGRLLIALFSALDFERNFGSEYFLAGDTYEYPSGEIGYVNFDGNVVSWPPGLDQTYQTFMITNCFLYATYAAPVVCIDPAPFSEDRKVCRPSRFTGTKGQGAPVAVTYIEQENTPKQAIFTIHIKNVGGGQVYDPGFLEWCSPYYPGRVTNEILNIVYVGDVRVSGDLQRLRCTPNDYVRLDPRTGEGIITCAYDIPYSGLRSAYKTPLVVELWYGYSKTRERQVLFKRAV